MAPRLSVHAGGIGDIQHRIPLRAALHALVDARQEARSEAARAAVGLDSRGDENDEAGEILVLAPQAVGRPAPQARPARSRGTGVEEELRRGVVELVGVHAADDTQPVGDALQIGDRVGKLHAALAAALPAAGSPHELRRAAGEGERLPANCLGRAILPRMLHELRLVVVEIEMGRRAGEVDDDHPLRLRREVRHPRGERIGRHDMAVVRLALRPPRLAAERRRTPEERFERQPTDAPSHATEEVATGGEALLFEDRIHGADSFAHGHMNDSSRFRITLATTVHAARSARSLRSAGGGPSGSVASFRASSGVCR